MPIAVHIVTKHTGNKQARKQTKPRKHTHKVPDTNTQTVLIAVFLNGVSDDTQWLSRCNRADSVPHCPPRVLNKSAVFRRDVAGEEGPAVVAEVPVGGENRNVDANYVLVLLILNSDIARAKSSLKQSMAVSIQTN